MKLSIIVPVYNEEKTIVDVIEKLQSINFGIEKEIIVVNDGSTDNTANILKQYNPKDKVLIIHHIKNLGKGAALRTAFSKISGDIIAIQDADLEYNPEEINKLIQPILHNGFLIVYGSRFLKENPVIYKRYYLGNRIISGIVSLLFRQKITDSYTCYKVFHKKVLENINLSANGFEIEAELTCKFIKNGYKILELPIDYCPRSIKQGKKIKFKDALKGLFTILKIKILG